MFFGFIKNYRPKPISGYTLIEVVVVISIMMILSGVSLYNYQSRKQENLLLLEAQKISQLFRRAQNLALSPIQTGVKGYGVFLDRTTNDIILFADRNLDDRYSNPIEIIEQFSLNPSLELAELYAPSGNPSNWTNLHILYVPPDPSVVITGGALGASDMSAAVRLKNDPARRRVIIVNITGLVEVQ